MYGIRFVSTIGRRPICVDGPSVGQSGLRAYSKSEAIENAASLNRYVSPGYAYLIVPLP